MTKGTKTPNQEFSHAYTLDLVGNNIDLPAPLSTNSIFPALSVVLQVVAM